MAVPGPYSSCFWWHLSSRHWVSTILSCHRRKDKKHHTSSTVPSIYALQSRTMVKQSLVTNMPGLPEPGLSHTHPTPHHAKCSHEGTTYMKYLSRWTLKWVLSAVWWAHLIQAFESLNGNQPLPPEEGLQAACFQSYPALASTFDPTHITPAALHKRLSGTPSYEVFSDRHADGWTDRQTKQMPLSPGGLKLIQGLAFPQPLRLSYLACFSCYNVNFVNLLGMGDNCFIWNTWQCSRSNLHQRVPFSEQAVMEQETPRGEF